jgi:hypothetical protein
MPEAQQPGKSKKQIEAHQRNGKTHSREHQDRVMRAGNIGKRGDDQQSEEAGLRS